MENDKRRNLEKEKMSPLEEVMTFLDQALPLQLEIYKINPNSRYTEDIPKQTLPERTMEAAIWIK